MRDIGVNSEKKLNVINRMTMVIIILLPFLVVGGVLLISGYGLRYSVLVPVWNDEVLWWGQVSDMIHYGRPLGYIGYNGTHAAVGTWGPWGWAPILPYCLFGRIFGWELYSMPLANMTFLALALMVYLVLVKPGIRQKVWLIVLYLCMNITVGYSMTSMAEGLRYSLGIVLAGLLIWLERRMREKDQKISGREIVIFALIAVFIYYTVLVYLIFALVIPLYCWCFFRHCKALPRVGISVAVTGIAAVTANHFVSAASAPYIVSTMGSIFAAFQEGGFGEGCCYALDSFFNNLATVSLSGLRGLFRGNQVLFWFFVLYLVLLCYLVCRIVILIAVKKLNREDSQCCVKAAWMMAGFLFGYCALYSGADWTLCRGINTGLMMALLFLLSAERIIDKAIVATVSLLGIAGSFSYLCSMADERFSEAQYVEAIAEERRILSNVIEISEDNSTWENTIAHYGELTSMYLALPTGWGGSYMLNGETNEKAKYALITRGTAEEDEYKRMLVADGHRVIYEDDYFVVLVKISF